MKAAVLYDVDDIRIERRPIPTLGEGDLLVKTMASGICSGDIMPWYIRRKAPLVLGHEPAGVIAAVGPGLAPRDEEGVPFRVGDRVFTHHHAPCFACASCARRDYVQCSIWRGSALDPGAMAEYIRVPAVNVRDTLRLPERVTFADGSLVEPLACVVKSLRRSHLREGESLYVIGLGVMGLMHVALGAARGARVFASDFSGSRRAAAQALGAATVFDAAGDVIAPLRAATERDGADVVICGPGNAPALQHALEAAARGGTVVMFTPLEPGERFQFDQSGAYFRDLSLVASYSCGPADTREALECIAAGVVTAERLGASEYAIGDVARAYTALRRAEEVVKPIVLFE